MKRLTALVLTACMIGCGSNQKEVPREKYMELEVNDLRKIEDGRWSATYRGTAYQLELDKKHSKIIIYKEVENGK